MKIVSYEDVRLYLILQTHHSQMIKPYTHFKFYATTRAKAAIKSKLNPTRN